MPTYYDDTAQHYAEVAEAAAAAASLSKQQASTSATTATIQANIATNAASNAAALVKSDLQNAVSQMKQDALSAATNASNSASSASASAVSASNSAIAAEEYARTTMPIVLNAPPTTSTQATLGKLGLWHDTVNDANHLYHLAYITTSDNTTVYHWEECVLVSNAGQAGGVVTIGQDGKISASILPLPGNSTLGGVAVSSTGANGVSVSNTGVLSVEKATTAEIDAMADDYKVIVPSNLDYAVAAALTGTNHMTLSAAQQAVAQEVLGVTGGGGGGGLEPLTGHGAPTGSTAAAYGQLYKDLDTGKIYLCINAVTQNSTTTTTWLELVLSDQKGTANGVASLGSDGKVPSAQLPTIPTALSQLTDDSTHRVVTDTDITTWNGKSTFSGSYTDLTDKPTIPTALSQLTDDSTHRVVTDTEKTTWNGKSNFSGSYTDLTDKPTIPSTASDVGAIPATDKGVANGVASLDSVGKVNSSQLPTIPTALSQLTEDATHRVVTDTEKTAWNNKSNFSGSYTDLTDKPTIPSTAADVGAIPTTDKGANNGVATLDGAGKVTSTQLPTIPAAPLVLDAAPTTATVGVLGQLAIDTTHYIAYILKVVYTDDSDPQAPVTLYYWAPLIDGTGGSILGGTLAFIDYNNQTPTLYLAPGAAVVGENSVIANNAVPSAIVGDDCTVSAEHFYSLLLGYGLITGNAFQFVQGMYNVATVNAFRVVGAGSGSANRKNVEELSTAGNHYIAGGHQQKVTTIPAATSSYTLSEGVYVHTPQTASLYILPTVTDYTRTHTCVITIKFSANVLTYEFQDSDGVTQPPLQMEGSIEPGAVVTFLCMFNTTLLNTWTIFPVLDGVIVSP